MAPAKIRLLVRYLVALLLTIAVSLSFGRSAAAHNDPLPSWNDGTAKEAIISFVQKTTDQASPSFVPPASALPNLIRTGSCGWNTLHIRRRSLFGPSARAREGQPELVQVEPFKTVLSGSRDAVAKLSMREMFEIVLATQSGMTVEQFKDDVKNWLATAKLRFKC
jgi:hypothetical protein